MPRIAVRNSGVPANQLNVFALLLGLPANTWLYSSGGNAKPAAPLGWQEAGSKAAV
jgi:hypothetical protein